MMKDRVLRHENCQWKIEGRSPQQRGWKDQEAGRRLRTWESRNTLWEFGKRTLATDGERKRKKFELAITKNSLRGAVSERRRGLSLYLSLYLHLHPPESNRGARPSPALTNQRNNVIQSSHDSTFSSPAALLPL